jgi:hypothetical protein
MRSRTALALFVLAGLAGLATAGPAAAQARYEGRWTILGIDDASPVKEGGEWIGRTITFSRNAIAAPSPLDCAKPTYEIVRVPPQGFFQGSMSEAEAAAFAKRRNVTGEAETLRVSCDSGVFDYHAVGQRLVIMLDGVIYVLARAP